MRNQKTQRRRVVPVASQPAEAKAAPNLGVFARWIAVLIFVVFAYLVFKSLDHTYFWDDEAEVGIIARNLANTGRLTGWDGRNLFAYGNGALLDGNLRPINPPLQYLVAAASFKLFGATTWAGRFPFALFGLATLGVFALVLQREFKGQTILQFYAFAALSLSVEFILYIRQCRYYALALFSSLLTFYVYGRCLEKRGWKEFILLGVTAALFFYSHYLLCLSFLLALAVTHFVFHRREFDLRHQLGWLVATGVFLLITLPYALKYRIWVRPDISKTIPGLQRLKSLWFAFAQLSEANWLPWMVLTGLIYLLIRERKNELLRRKAWPWLVLNSGYVVFVWALAPGALGAPERYLVVELPFLAGLLGVFLWLLHRRAPAIAFVLAITVLTTNLLGLTPGHRAFRWLLPAYLGEIHRPFPTCYSEAANWLSKECPPESNVVSYPEFCAYPLIFYCGDKFRFGCLLQKETTKLPLQIVSRLGAPLMIGEHFPDYIIGFGAAPELRLLLDYYSRSHEEADRAVSYHYPAIARVNCFSEDTSRPELAWHTFGPKTGYDPESEAVFLFKRMGGPQ